MTFREAFCAHCGCAASEFPDRALRRFLYPHAAVLAPLVQRLSPSFFKEDQQVIDQLGLDRNLEEVDATLRDFQYVNRARRHWLRTGWKLRLSGRKARGFAAEVFG